MEACRLLGIPLELVNQGVKVKKKVPPFGGTLLNCSTSAVRHKRKSLEERRAVSA
jgi:hypothetical protein